MLELVHNYVTEHFCLTNQFSKKNSRMMKLPSCDISECFSVLASRIENPMSNKSVLLIAHLLVKYC